MLADGPDLDPRAVERVLAHRDDADVVAASYDGTRSHPVVLARACGRPSPTTAARALEPVLVDCSDLQPPGDVDYRRLASSGVRSAASFAFSSGDIGSVTATRT